MIIGLDIGYSHVKAVSDNRETYFPSTVGNLEREHFSLNGVADERLVVNVEGDWYMVGEEAKLQSRFARHREDQDWINSVEYQVLYLAALSRLTTASGPSLRIVTGLPVIYYHDREGLEKRLVGDHRAQCEGRNWQTFKISQVVVLPQPFGTLLSEVLDDNGQIIDNELATGRVGIIDIGGGTTGFLTVDTLREIARETTAINKGCWDPLRLLGETVNDHYRGLDLSDHEVVDVAIQRFVEHFGEKRNISDLVQKALEPFAESVIAEARKLWGRGARLRAVLVSGGGAMLIGPIICKEFPHARIVNGPVFANAIGFYKFGKRLWA